MTTMTIEEKAKAYDEAFRIAQELYNNPNSSNIGKGYVCTVFPELKESEDEQSKKWILEYLYDGLRKSDEQFKDHFRAAIAWLEKQGEQKFADGTFVNVDDVREDFVQEVYRVLDADSTNDRANQIIYAFDNLPTVIVEKQGEHKPVKEHDVCNNCDEKASCVIPCPIKLIEQKPAWSKEDEKMLSNTVDCIKNLPIFYESIDINGEDKTTERFICDAINWLKSLKERVQLQLKKEWSEEDEKEVAVLEAYIRSKDWSDRHIDRALGIVDELVNKVKSLRPQNTWKPSEEQIMCLQDAISDYHRRGYKAEILETLLKQLKQL